MSSRATTRSSAKSTSTSRRTSSLASVRRGRPGLRAVQHPAPRRDSGRSSPTCSGSAATPSPCSACGWAAGSAARRCSRTGSRRSPRLGTALTEPPGALPPDPDPGHDDDRESGPGSTRHGRSASTPTASSSGSKATLTADGGWSLDLIGAGARPGAVPHRQRLLDPEHRGARPDRQDAQDVAHRLPRLRRAAGDARDRGRARALRAGRSGSTPAELRRRNFYVPRPDHAVRAAGDGTPSACRRSGRRCWTASTFDRRGREIAAFNAAQPAREARPRDHAGQVRHLVQPRRRSTRPARWCSSTRTAPC